MNIARVTTTIATAITMAAPFAAHAHNGAHTATGIMHLLIHLFSGIHPVVLVVGIGAWAFAVVLALKSRH